MPLKPVESLADRRKNRRQVNLGEDDELGNEYDKLLKFGEIKESLDEIEEVEYKNDKQKEEEGGTDHWCYGAGWFLLGGVFA